MLEKLTNYAAFVYVDKNIRNKNCRHFSFLKICSNCIKVEGAGDIFPTIGPLHTDTEEFMFPNADGYILESLVLTRL